MASYLEDKEDFITADEVYKNRDKFVHMDDSDCSDVITGFSLIYLNGKHSAYCLKANANEGWIDVPVVSGVDFKRVDINNPLTMPYECIEYFRKDDGKLLETRLKGDVVIIKCDPMGKIVEK